MEQFTIIQYTPAIMTHPGGYEGPKQLYFGAVGQAVYWTGGLPPSVYFSAIHMEGSSQGLDSSDPTHWVVINCQ